MDTPSDCPGTDPFPHDPGASTLLLRVGSRFVVDLGSVRLRQALRRAVELRVARLMGYLWPLSALPDALLRRAVLYLLWLSVNGVRHTRRMLDALAANDPQVGLDAFLIQRCQDEATNPRHQARARRAREVFGVFPIPLLIGCIEAVEIIVEEGTSPVRKSTKRLSLPKPRQGSVIRPPVPFADDDPPLQLARPGTRAFFGFEQIHPARLCNILSVGGTGSGKTTATVLPLLDGLLRYRLTDGTHAAVLVIDPKAELLPRVQKTLAELGEADRLVVIGDGTAPIAYFPPGSPLSPTERLEKLKVFDPEGNTTGDRNSYWRCIGHAFLRDLVQVEAKYFWATGQRLFQQLSDELKLPRQGNAWATLREVLGFARLSSQSLRRVSALLLGHCEDAGLDLGTEARALAAYTGDTGLIEQFNFVLMSGLDTLGAALANPDTASLVDFDVVADSQHPRTDVAALMDAGRVVVFQPQPREGHRVAAMALKSKWYEAVFARQNLQRPVGIVIDEAQQFLTNDEESGEQNFLDRCRAYRCITLLATQSLASLRYRFGSNEAARNALDIIVANCPSKFILRNTDGETLHWLREQIPPPSLPGRHIVEARPPSGLKRGEAYYLLADGTWGRSRASLAGLAGLA